jgi:hypothetical protein
MAWLLGARLRGARDTVAQHATAGRSGAVPPARGSWLMSWLLGAAAARELLLAACCATGSASFSHSEAAHGAYTFSERTALAGVSSLLHGVSHCWICLVCV